MPVCDQKLCKRTVLSNKMRASSNVYKRAGYKLNLHNKPVFFVRLRIIYSKIIHLFAEKIEKKILSTRISTELLNVPSEIFRSYASIT